MHVQICTSISRSAYQFDTAIDAGYITTACNVVELEKRAQATRRLAYYPHTVCGHSNDLGTSGLAENFFHRGGDYCIFIYGMR